MNGESLEENKVPLEDIKEKKIKPLYYTKKEPRKALSTFFRNQNKVLVSYLAISDRKAMIMIRVNSMIVSAAILFYRYLNDNLPHGWLIALILIIGAGGALVFSVLAAKPNGYWLLKFFNKNVKPTYPDLKYNNFYPIGNYTLDEYEKSMDEVVRSQELQIGNQTRFAYTIESYLRNKYRLLDIAYNLFLCSFMLIAVVFIVGRFF
jgi:hypothetical protein